LRRPPLLGCAWVSPSLQKLLFTPTRGDIVAHHLRGVLYGNLPALWEVQVGRVRLPALPRTEEGAAAIELLRACLASTPVRYSICGISLEQVESDESEMRLQPWLQPLAGLFADHTHAACVEDVNLDNITVDAGNIQGLASVFPAMKGEAQMIPAAPPLL